MTTNTTETPERPADIIEQLHAEGVDRALIMKTLDCIEAERAKAITTAARLFYNGHGEDGQITPVEFADELNTMKRRIWGLVAAVGDLVDGGDDAISAGVQQLMEDVACDMDRLSEAFDAERWLARKQEPQS
jgi:hypothetical protein